MYIYVRSLSVFPQRGKFVIILILCIFYLLKQHFGMFNPNG